MTFEPLPRPSSRNARRRAALRSTLVAGLLVASAAGCSRKETLFGGGPAPEERPDQPSLETSNEVEKRPNEPIASLLEARFPGVSVSTGPGGSLIVRIRGTSSFYSSTEPLYVVDGTPIRPSPLGGLTGINPHDIESIKVLKYPTETSLYGLRGANGVILITTKRP